MLKSKLSLSTSRVGGGGVGGGGGGTAGVDLPDADWMCAKCSGRNFKRRENCFKCGLSKAESVRMVSQDGNQDVGSTPSTTVLLRELDALTQEDSIRFDNDNDKDNNDKDNNDNCNNIDNNKNDDNKMDDNKTLIA